MNRWGQFFLVSADVLEEGERWCGMEFGPVERVRAVGPMEVRRIPVDVMPASGVEGAERMEEDTYREGSEGQDRGLEPEPPLIEEECAEVPEQAPEAGEEKQVNLFA